MKYIIYPIVLLISILTLSSCQKVVDIPLVEGKKELVIEANLDWEKNTFGNEQTIEIKTTTPFFEENSSSGVSGAKVSVRDKKGNTFIFSENPNKKGSYGTTTFSPTLDTDYFLEVKYQGKKYQGKTLMKSAPSDLSLVQKNNGGVLGNSTELRGFFRDNVNKGNNFYLIRIDSEQYKKPTYISIDGRLFNNNQLFFIYTSEKIKPKDILKIRIYSITNAYYDYINQLLAIAQGGNGTGPFGTPPATIRGNIESQNSQEENPLGYFRATQFLEEEYTVK